MRSTNLGTKLIKVNTLSYKTVSANKATVEKEWYIVDAKDEVLGRLASVVAVVLRGKHKPSFTPHVDCGDNVIVINAEKIKLTGKKMTDKKYVQPHRLSRVVSVIGLPKIFWQKNPKQLLKKLSKGCSQRADLEATFSGTCM